MAETGAQPDRRDLWIRGLIMLLFIILLNVAQWLLNLVAVLQFLWLLFTGHANPQITAFGRSLGQWLQELARFQSCDSEDKPFPWRAWPSAG